MLKSLCAKVQKWHPWVWYSIAFVSIVLDQITKKWADASLTYNTPVEVFSFFNITLRYNTGAAFSMFADAGGWQRYMLGGIAAVVSVVLVVWIAKLKSTKWLEALGLSLILGGAIGNLYDRVLLGHVIDFIEFHWFETYYFPAFNIADSAITLGAGCLIFDGVFLSKDKKDA